jgi:hypothetical protein
MKKNIGLLIMVITWTILVFALIGDGTIADFTPKWITNHVIALFTFGSLVGFVLGAWNE